MLQPLHRATDERGRRRNVAGWPARVRESVLAVALLLLAWWLVSLEVSPVVLPSPYAVLQAFWLLLQSGILVESIGVSAGRIFSGWMLGAIVGIALGILLGLARPARLLFGPYIEGLRYIPPIAFISLFVIWFGTGEASKILLLFYTSVFIVAINTMAGVASVTQGSLRAARSLGANERQLLVHVMLPQTVPHVVTGLRLALANVFLTIVAAEMMAAESGIGYLIWSSRDFMLTDQVLAAVIVAGLLGIAMDRLFQRCVRPIMSRFGRR
jgi:NitT/TauT family transport system permease protein